MSHLKQVTSNAGVKIPGIIYGTAWKKELTAELALKALQAGFTGIDTACQPKHYDESLVGEAVNQWLSKGAKREDLYLQTKFTPLDGQDPERVPYDIAAPLNVQVAQSFETSKQNLQTSYVDCLILHSPLKSHEQTMKAWQAMEEIHATGGARQLGISNCYDSKILRALYADAKTKPAILQNRFYKDTGYDVALRQFCANHDIIYQSFWTLTANPHVLRDNVIQVLGQKYQKTAVQIFFRYLSQTGVVPLTGTTSEQHMKEDLAIFAFELTQAELSSIQNLLV